MPSCVNRLLGDFREWVVEISLMTQVAAQTTQDRTRAACRDSLNEKLYMSSMVHKVFERLPECLPSWAEPRPRTVVKHEHRRLSNAVRPHLMQPLGP